jgi:hypothetical protein
MDVPTATTVTTGSASAVVVSARGGGEAGIPFVVKGNAEAGGEVRHEGRRDEARVLSTDPLQKVVREIGGSTFVVFIDDFHYISRDIQAAIGKQIKEASEGGVRFCTASVPHRSDDVVRSNPELRGRVTAIDLDYWTIEELMQIPYQGFRELNVDLAPEISRRLADESFGSPQLIQAICLNLCQELRLEGPLPTHERVNIPPDLLRTSLERTSTTADFSSLLRKLHSGPKQRGTERKEFTFTDGTRGDVYRCVLLAMQADPPSLSIRYDDMLRRTHALCDGESPVGSSVVQALQQIQDLASSAQSSPVIEWDENVLEIVEPYFLFFLRHSGLLARLGKRVD